MDPNSPINSCSKSKRLLFEKPLTPSDVGKLNRLVIPKHHAETCFPLGGGDKTLLLGFEDESGKPWKFRYSYWSSSQSYVLTKGWSRYVREKSLAAGDFVLFGRHLSDRHRLFIGWRRKDEAAHDSTGGAGFYPARLYPTHHHHRPNHQPPDRTHHNTEFDNSSGGSGVVPAGNLKRLRLFGVNLECQAGDSSDRSSLASTSSQGYHYQQQQYHYSSDHHNYKNRESESIRGGDK